MQSRLGFAEWSEGLDPTLNSGSAFSLNCAILKHSGERAGPGSQPAKAAVGGFRRDQPASCGLEEGTARCFKSSLSSLCHPSGL